MPGSGAPSRSTRRGVRVVPAGPAWAVARGSTPADRAVDTGIGRGRARRVGLPVSAGGRRPSSVQEERNDDEGPGDRAVGRGRGGDRHDRRRPAIAAGHPGAAGRVAAGAGAGGDDPGAGRRRRGRGAPGDHRRPAGAEHAAGPAGLDAARPALPGRGAARPAAPADGAGRGPAAVRQPDRPARRRAGPGPRRPDARPGDPPAPGGQPRAEGPCPGAAEGRGRHPDGEPLGQPAAVLRRPARALRQLLADLRADAV